MRTSTKFVHMMPLGSKLAPPQGSQVGTWEQRSPSSKFFFSDTGWRRDLIFGMWHLLWTSTKFVHKMPLGSKQALPWGSLVEHRNKFVHMMPLGSKLAPPQGSQVGTWEQRSPSSKFFFSDTGWRRDLIFGMWHLLWTSTKFVHKMPLGSKQALPWGSLVEHRNKERKFHNSSTLKLDGLEL